MKSNIIVINTIGLIIIGLTIYFLVRNKGRRIRIDNKGRILTSTGYIRKLNKRGLVEALDLKIEDCPDKSPIALKVIPVENSDKIKVDKLFMDGLKINIGDKVSIKGFKNKLEFISEVEGYLKTNEERVIGLDDNRIKMLEIYEGDIVF